MNRLPGAVRDPHDQMAATTARLRENTRSGDYAYYGDNAAFVADLSSAQTSGTRWADSGWPLTNAGTSWSRPATTTSLSRGSRPADGALMTRPAGSGVAEMLIRMAIFEEVLEAEHHLAGRGSPPGSRCTPTRKGLRVLPADVLVGARVRFLRALPV